MEGYGQTETVVCIANYPWMNPKPGSMGKPAPGFDILLVGKNDKLCEVGEEGEIVIYNDATLEEVARIPQLITPTGKFNVYNTITDTY